MPKPTKEIPQCIRCKCPVFAGETYCRTCRDAPIPVGPPRIIDPDTAAERRASREPDLVNEPPHYRTGYIECIEAIEAALTPEEFRGYCKGNAMKYEWRERHKGGDQDLAKAAWYLNRAQKKTP